MGCYIKTLLVVLAAIMSFFSVQTVRADDITVTGTIIEADRFSRTIVIQDEVGELVTIVGFPFNNLEAQLDEELDPLDPEADGITIEAGDCVTVEYSEKELTSEYIINKWESLTKYCEECTTEIDLCYIDADLTRQPQQNQNRPNPWPWHGKPPGHRR